MVYVYKVLTPDRVHEVGVVSKQWSGFAREYFTKATNFNASCKTLSNDHVGVNRYPSRVRSQRPILGDLCKNWRGKG